MLALVLMLFATVVGLLGGFLLGRAGFVQAPARWLYWLFILWSAAGVALIRVDSADLQDKIDQKHWPKTQGVIKAAEIMKTRSLQPRIIFVYKVDSLEYTCETNLNTPAFGGKNTRLATAEAVVGEYPPGKSVTVFYNPKNPADAALKVGPTWDIIMKLGFGVFLLLTGIMGLATVAVAAKKSKQAG